ncbi:cilia- and flagella-associated protein 90-like [Diadema setosum]|uniref:cilia- and flagella-associated protein 90-like n=1 Tax=Diadema setosum TaxID=31175 RepID=UPI003B3AF47C
MEMEKTAESVVETERKPLKEYPGLMDDGHPLASKSAFSYVPTTRNDPAEMNAFNSKVEPKAHCTYDRLFNKPEGYNMKLHRCDREHAKSKGLHVNDEERVKVTPTLSSTVYGHKLEDFVDPPGRAHVRVGHVNSEFYRRNGINVSGGGY